MIVDAIPYNLFLSQEANSMIATNKELFSSRQIYSFRHSFK